MLVVGLSGHSLLEEPCVYAHTACSDVGQSRRLISAQLGMDTMGVFIMCLFEEGTESGLDFSYHAPEVWCIAYRGLSTMSCACKVICDMVPRYCNKQGNPMSVYSGFLHPQFLYCTTVSELAEHVALHTLCGPLPSVYCHLCQEDGLMVEWHRVSLSGQPHVE